MRIARLLAIGLCLVGLSVVPALAQRPTGGVEVGGGVSKVSPPGTAQSVSVSPGVLAGVYAVFPVLKTMSFQPEVIYSRKGSELSTAVGATTQGVNLNLDYLEVPLLARMAMFKGIYMTEGIALGFPARAEVNSASGATTDVKSQVTSPDVGIVIGGGVSIQKAAVEFRYTGGVRRVNTTAGTAVQRNRSYVSLVRVQLF